MSSLSKTQAKAACACIEAAIKLEVLADYPNSITRERLSEIAADLRAAYQQSMRHTGSASTAPARIVLHINGTRRELLPTDRVADIARIARASHKLTGQPARLSCSGWDWTRKAQRSARHD